MGTGTRASSVCPGVIANVIAVPCRWVQQQQAFCRQNASISHAVESSKKPRVSERQLKFACGEGNLHERAASSSEQGWREWFDQKCGQI